MIYSRIETVSRFAVSLSLCKNSFRKQVLNSYVMTETVNADIADSTTEKTSQPLLNDILRDLCANNAEYFAGDITENGQRLYLSFLSIKGKIDDLQPLIEDLEQIVADYDFDENTPGNGYRSFLSVVQSAKEYAVQINKKVCLKRDSVLFRKTNITKEVESCAQIFASLETCLTILRTITQYSPKSELFATEHANPKELIAQTEEINQYCFYGRSLGFQYSETLRGILQFISLSMAIFSEAYYSEGSILSKATTSLLTSTRYLSDPDLRGRRIVNISRNADVHFCKAFWFLSEGELMKHVPAVVAQRVAVCKVINIPTEPLMVEAADGSGREVEVAVPNAHIGRKAVQVRLISHEAREGMIGEGVAKNSKLKPPSRGLLIHCHGGGFVAQSSRSHESYLRQWARDLGVPILSIDYSLAPAAPYPRALEEVLYAYCWARKNHNLLGSTGERIVAAGDSAGANLLSAATLKCIEKGIPPPAGLMLAYVPTFVNFIPSPARLLCMMDPLLPFGILMRCLQAYVCSTTPAHTPNDTPSHLTHPPTNLQHLTSDTESFEEITESDLLELQAHKSPVSEMSDTLTYGSLSSQHTEGNGGGFTAAMVEVEQQGGGGAMFDLDGAEIALDIEDSEEPTVGSSAGTTRRVIKEGEEVEDGMWDGLEKYVLDSDTDTDGTKLMQLDPNVASPSTPTNATDNNRHASRLRLEDYIPLKVSHFVAKLRSQVSSMSQNLPSFGSNVDNATTTTNSVNLTNGVNTKPAPVITASMMLDIDTGMSTILKCIPDNVPLDPFISPYCAKDEVLRGMPPVKIVTVHLDPCLDDCVMFAKKLKRLGNDVNIDILSGLPHGFLNFSLVSKEAYEGSKLCAKRISELLDLDNLPTPT